MPENNEELNLAESVTANQNPLEDELSQVRASLVEFKGLVAQKDEELSSANARVSELEQTTASLESEIVALKEAAAEADDNLSKLNESLTQAVASYKEIAIQSNPDVPEELVTGDSIEAINISLASAKELVSKVKKGLEADIALTRVPAGAPERTAPDLSALSPREKIQYAIRGSSS